MGIYTKINDVAVNVGVVEQSIVELQPALTPASDEQLAKLIIEGVQVAEVSKMKGHDKFRVARDYVLNRAKVLNLQIDTRTVALRIEATVAAMKLPTPS